MRSFLQSGLLLIFSAGLVLAEPETFPLWPDGPPDTNGLSGPETVGKCIRNISEPTITLYRAGKNKATGAAVVVMPGGGYGAVCESVEGGPIAKHLVERGITAIVLKYRLPNQHHLIPANDARRAIRTVRARAEEWGIDPKRVGVWGFSAGGHLASTVSTVFDAGNQDSPDAIEKESSRPDFTILFYPVIIFSDDNAHKGSRRNLVGDGTELHERYSSDMNVNEKTPPAYLLHCSDDRGVVVENSLRYYQALVKNKVPASCSIYEKGGHGPSAFERNPGWKAELDHWLKARGALDRK